MSEVSTVEREIGKLIAGQESLQSSMATMAKSITAIADNQSKILSIQEQHHANAKQIEHNRQAIENNHAAIDAVRYEVKDNTRFRKNFMMVFWKILTPAITVITIAAIGIIAAGVIE